MDKAFLSGRSHRVRINGCLSRAHNVTSGIPQGSVLGPLLFVLYINDLPDNIDSESYLFADDTKIFQEISSEEDSIILQNDLTKLLEWSDRWLLKFCPDKCTSLSINKRQDAEAQYKLGDHTLSVADKEKDIGVIIDKDLTFSDHMNDKINKANRIIGLVRRSLTYLTEDIFLQLYKALVQPHLEYANCIWFPYKKKDITSLFHFLICLPP